MKTKKTVLDRIKNMGPGAIITAAVVGPGTVTTSGLAGFGFGYSLAWALLFSVIAMAIMQHMTSRIGLVGNMGLASAIRKTFAESPFRIPLFILVIIAIFCGNCAYQAGNLIGSATGVSLILGEHTSLYCMAISVIALALILTGSIDYISKALTGLVFVMAIVFLITAIIIKPDLGALLSGMFIPTIPQGATLNAIALIGTTLVPYCIYLHAASASSTRDANPDMDVDEALVDATFDSVTNAILTAVISISIMVVGAGLCIQGETVASVGDLAKGLEPLAGSWAKTIFALGIFAAGISSATTAPLGATYVITGILGWSTDLKDKKFRTIAVVVFVIGLIVSLTGGTPTDIITMAQAINGVVLPLSVVLVVYVASRSDILGKYKNTPLVNALGLIVLIITLFMAYRTFVVYAPAIAGWFGA